MMYKSTRSELPDNMFGLPNKRKYPLETKKHVLSAIRFFNYVDNKDDEKELASNIIDKIKEYNMEDEVHPSERNRFFKYYSGIMTESKIERKTDDGKKVPEVCPKCGSKVGLFLKGEPVWLCSNKNCNHYFGTAPFNESADNLSYEDRIIELYESFLRDEITEDDLLYMLESVDSKNN